MHYKWLYYTSLDSSDEQAMVNWTDVFQCDQDGTNQLYADTDLIHWHSISVVPNFTNYRSLYMILPDPMPLDAGITSA